jgi:hypothetical protein
MKNICFHCRGSLSPHRRSSKLTATSLPVTITVCIKLTTGIPSTRTLLCVKTDTLSTPLPSLSSPLALPRPACSSSSYRGGRSSSRPPSFDSPAFVATSSSRQSARSDFSSLQSGQPRHHSASSPRITHSLPIPSPSWSKCTNTYVSLRFFYLPPTRWMNVFLHVVHSKFHSTHTCSRSAIMLPIRALANKINSHRSSTVLLTEYGERAFPPSNRRPYFTFFLSDIA